MDLSRIFDGKKFMWDGVEYQTEKEAKEKAENYQKENFEVQVFKEKEKFYVFTRRVVTEVVIQ